MHPNEKKVLIIGGGFGGISAALELEKITKEVKITLVSDRNHFEFHPALYRVVTGETPLEVCVPLSHIFEGKKIEVLQDKIVSVDLASNEVLGESGSHYTFDYLILALGAETAYFNIPGLKEYSFGFKSITEALKLKRHLHAVFEKCLDKNTKDEEKVCLLHFVVVGAGASGVELAGELALYTEKLAREHKIPKSLITIDLIEGAASPMPALPEKISEKISGRLHKLGVNLFMNRPMEKEEIESIMARGISLKTDTVIWTAGIEPNALYKKISGLAYDKRGRVLVDEYLQAKNFKKIFVIGDGASTLYSGMASTAIHDGKTVALNIKNSILGRAMKKYIPVKPFFSIPIGPGWAATGLGKINIYGYFGWLLRRAADLRYFLSILSISKAYLAFSRNKICDTCPVCEPEKTEEFAAAA